MSTRAGFIATPSFSSSLAKASIGVRPAMSLEFKGPSIRPLLTRYSASSTWPWKRAFHSNVRPRLSRTFGSAPPISINSSVVSINAACVSA
ncbi:ankyrin repeat protein, partial [Colletotrichum scovillei]